MLLTERCLTSRIEWITVPKNNHRFENISSDAKDLTKKGVIIIMCHSYITPNDTVGANDSESIQRAVNLAKERGVNKVVIPRINSRTGEARWEISATVRLPSDITVILDDCFMQMADEVVGGFFCSDNLFTSRGTSPEHRMSNITIKGEGHAVLDGGNPTGLSEKTQNDIGFPVRLNTPIFFMNVTGFSVQNISITNQRYWGMRFQFCDRGIIRDIFFSVKRDRFNQDGINLRNGCHDILIENIFGQTGDDMIALSAIDTDKKVGFNADYPLIVEGLPWDIHDVTIRNVSGAAIRHPLVAMRNHNGAKLYNISIENLRDTEMITEAENDNYERYALVAIGGNSYAGIRFAEMGETHDISIRTLHAQYSVRAINVQSVIKNLDVSDVHASGVCRTVIATSPDGWANSKSGVKIENLSIKSVYFTPSDGERSKVLDFGGMREGDYIKNLSVDDAYLENVKCFAVIDEITELADIKQGRIYTDSASSLEVCRRVHYDDTPKEIRGGVWLVNGVETKEIDM